MGDTVRAKNLSDRFKNRTLKAIALYGFDKCGNCINRIKCGEELLASGKKNHPIKIMVDGMMEGCPKTHFKTKGFVAKEVAEFVNGECARCDKNDICIGYIAEHVGRSSPEEKKAVIERFQGCLKCEDLDNCIQYYMTQLGISKLSLIKGAALMKFRKCSNEQMMTISLDLPSDASANVGGAIKTSHREVKKEDQ